MLPLALGEQREIGDALIRLGEDSLQQYPQVLGHAGDGGGVEQVGVVDEGALEASRCLADGQFEFELGDARARVQGPQREPGQGHLGHGGVQEGEEDLEERRAAEVALGLEFLDELLEGQVLVGIGAEGGLAHAAQQLAEGGVAAEPSAQGEGVGEEADETLELGLIAARDGGAHAEVVLAGVALEHDLEGGQQEHEGRDALALAQGLERLGQLS